MISVLFQLTSSNQRWKIV